MRASGAHRVVRSADLDRWYDHRERRPEGADAFGCHPTFRSGNFGTPFFATEQKPAGATRAGSVEMKVRR
jgi:hypothetical protein